MILRRICSLQALFFICTATVLCYICFVAFTSKAVEECLGKREASGGNQTQSVNNSRYQYDCSNIQHIDMKDKLGHGWFKQVYLGICDDGQKVAVKLPYENIKENPACGKEGQNKCIVRSKLTLLREIFHLEQLQHPNLIRMLGYCVQSDTESTPFGFGVVAISAVHLSKIKSTHQLLCFQFYSSHPRTFC